MKELSWSNGVEWGKIYCPMLGQEVMTYYMEGTPPYDTYTNPIVNEDGDVYYYRFDQDEGGWHEDSEWLGEYTEGANCKFG
ncbi:hypothetical protein COL94_28880 [Bacillus wiedmannii]|uniref:hypothetical protein n=1 Tax=Bacillus wiedmannii TaxID=1890302 RepID=UPI000BF968BA|nr:hypothetical protein [Bacillus wiedmannii]PGA79631.1 hypothetical protein COL94_28880 [Bacillus wiedmannii]